jgi:hypothetical protein
MNISVFPYSDFLINCIEEKTKVYNSPPNIDMGETKRRRTIIVLVSLYVKRETRHVSLYSCNQRRANRMHISLLL